MANIYYHELDEFVQGLKERLETPQTDRKNLKNQAYKSIEYKISKVHKEMRNHEHQSLERQKLAKELKSLRLERFETKGLKKKADLQMTG